jgi:hypothetical protein
VLGWEEHDEHGVRAGDQLSAPVGRLDAAARRIQTELDQVTGAEQPDLHLLFVSWIGLAHAASPPQVKGLPKQ